MSGTAIALFVVWLLGAIFVFAIRASEIGQHPDSMPGGGWVSVIGTALAWPLLLALALIAMALSIIGLL
jgi:hypothetical protein